MKGFASGSLKISNCVWSLALLVLHGCPSLKQWMVSSFEPSTGRFKAQLVKERLITSNGSSAQAFKIHCNIARLGGALRFPQAVSSLIPTVPSHSSYFSVHEDLKGLFQVTVFNAASRHNYTISFLRFQWLNDAIFHVRSCSDRTVTLTVKELPRSRSRKQAGSASNREENERTKLGLLCRKVHGPDIRASHSKNYGKRAYHPSREIEGPQ